LHEVGHCLGFRHTNWSTRGESQNPNGAFLINGTPSSDPNSFMNGGTAGASWAGFSTGDVNAFKNLYPLSPYASGIVPIYEYYSVASNNHYYTRSFTIPNGFVYHNIEWYVHNTQVSGTSALNRFVNPSNGDHYYTMGTGPYTGYQSEGNEGYVYSYQAPGTIPIYMFWNGSRHYYSTTSTTPAGYTSYGVSFYAYP
jgi:hypothetical protein